MCGGNDATTFTKDNDNVIQQPKRHNILLPMDQDVQSSQNPIRKAATD